jgi:predicted O-methyltransferase YrrM
MKSIISGVFDPIIQKIIIQTLANKPGGEISLEESRFIGELVRSIRTEGPIVEIGTHFGRSAQVFCLFKDPMRPLITVDDYSWNSLNLPQEKHYSTASHILKEAKEKFSVEQIKLDKNVFYATYSGPSPSLCFLDAVHNYDETKKDILWAKSVSSEIICGHDYDETHPGVVRAVEELGGCGRLVESIWVLKRQ